MCPRIAWFGGNRLFQYLHGFLVATVLGIGDSQGNTGIDMAGIEPNGLAQYRPGFPQPTKVAVGQPQVVEKPKVSETEYQKPLFYRFGEDKQLAPICPWARLCCRAAKIRAAMDASSFWTQFSTDWACLDCELMPWSVKAQELLRSQYAAVGASGRASLPKAVAAVRRAAERLAGQAESSPVAGQSSYTSDVDCLLRQYEHRGEAIEQFVSAYRQYCWPVESLDDLCKGRTESVAAGGRKT